MLSVYLVFRNETETEIKRYCTFRSKGIRKCLLCLAKTCQRQYSLMNTLIITVVSMEKSLWLCFPTCKCFTGVVRLVPFSVNAAKSQSQENPAIFGIFCTIRTSACFHHSRKAWNSSWGHFARHQSPKALYKGNQDLQRTQSNQKRPK